MARYTIEISDAEELQLVALQKVLRDTSEYAGITKGDLVKRFFQEGFRIVIGAIVLNKNKSNGQVGMLLDETEGEGS